MNISLAFARNRLHQSIGSEAVKANLLALSDREVYHHVFDNCVGTLRDLCDAQDLGYEIESTIEYELGDDGDLLNFGSIGWSQVDMNRAAYKCARFVESERQIRAANRACV